MIENYLESNHASMGRFEGQVQIERNRLLDALVTTKGDAPFFAGDHPGIGDLALYGQISGMCSGPTPQAERLIAERPALLDLRKRVEEVTATSGSV